MKLQGALTIFCANVKRIQQLEKDEKEEKEKNE